MFFKKFPLVPRAVTYHTGNAFDPFCRGLSEDDIFCTIRDKDKSNSPLDKELIVVQSLICYI